jgi:hypothetical protein
MVQRRGFVLFIVGLLLVGLFQSGFIHPAWSQPVTDDRFDKALVVLDGTPLLQLGGIQDFSAENRAEYVIQTLHQELRSHPIDDPIEVAVPKVTWLTIQINDRHLLTITEGDFMVGSSPVAQAQAWRAIIERGCWQWQQERSPSYQQQSWLASLSVLLGAIALQLGLQLLSRRITRQGETFHLFRWAIRRTPRNQFWLQISFVFLTENGEFEG